MIQNYSEIFDSSIVIPESVVKPKVEDVIETQINTEPIKPPEVEEKTIDFEVITSTLREKKAKDVEKEKVVEEKPPIPSRPILTQKPTLPTRKINAPLPPSRQQGKKIAPLPRLKKPSDKPQETSPQPIIPTIPSNSSPRNDLLSKDDSTSPRNELPSKNDTTLSSNNSTPINVEINNNNENSNIPPEISNDNSISNDPNEENVNTEIPPPLPILKPLSDEERKK